MRKIISHDHYKHTEKDVDQGFNWIMFKTNGQQHLWIHPPEFKPKRNIEKGYKYKYYKHRLRLLFVPTVLRPMFGSFALQLILENKGLISAS